MRGYVLDASAVLAVIQGEPGARMVRPILPEAALSTVNFAEVVSKLVDSNTARGEIDVILAPFVPAIVPFDSELARITGELRSHTRPLGLSLGDRACLALALTRGATALTADRAWARVDIGIDVNVIR